LLLIGKALCARPPRPPGNTSGLQVPTSAADLDPRSPRIAAKASALPHA
jgi:hypothetical protein